MWSWTPARIAFVALLVAVVTSAHVYLYRRLVRDVTNRPLLRRAGAGAFIVFALAAIAARPLARLLPDDGSRIAIIALLAWLGFILNLLLVTLALDVARVAANRWWKRALPVDPDRRQLLSRALAAGAAVSSGAIAGYGTWRAFHPPVITEVPVRLRGLPKALSGFTLVQLTDIHVGAVIRRSFMDELVRHANSAKPDAVVITGDLVDGTVPALGRYVAALQGLNAARGTFFVTGNHDYYSGADEWVGALEGLGVQVLRNRRVSLGDGQESFDLVGVDDWRADYDLNKALAGRDPSRASVLLAHQPSNFDAVAAAGVGLQLSGHTHGGQLFPGTGIARLIWGERSAGISSHGDAQLYVSRGCGFVGPPMRVGSEPEIVKVVLLPA